MHLNLHVLSPHGHSTVAELSESPLASLRLRLYPALTTLAENGATITFGDTITTKPNTLVVGKIGAANIEVRTPLWLEHMRCVQKSGARVVLDYTDHHLVANSVMTPFYTEAVKIADRIAVPNSALKTALLDHCGTGKDIRVIDDLLEYKPLTCKTECTPDGPTALWFGHPSNAPYLAELINRWPQEASDHRLLIVSSKKTIDYLQRYTFSAPPTVKLAFVPWSPSNLSSAAHSADYCVIPSDLESAKRYASNNRLVTALAFGLPTVAAPLPSYMEFSDYFNVLESRAALETMLNPWSQSSVIADFQNQFISRFSLAALTQHWRAILS